MSGHYYTEHGFRLIIRTDRADEAKEWYEEQTYEDPEKLIVSPVADTPEWSRIGFDDPYSTGFWDLDAPSDLDILKRFMEEFAHASSYVNLLDADASMLCRLQFEGKDVTQKVLDVHDAFDKVFGAAPELALDSDPSPVATAEREEPTRANALGDRYDAALETLWDLSLSDAPFELIEHGPDEQLGDQWCRFKRGTNAEDIWRWFDERHSKGVRHLLYHHEQIRWDDPVELDNRALRDIGYTGEIYKVHLRAGERTPDDGFDLIFAGRSRLYLTEDAAISAADLSAADPTTQEMLSMGEYEVVSFEVESYDYKDGYEQGPLDTSLTIDLYADGTVERWSDGERSGNPSTLDELDALSRTADDETPAPTRNNNELGTP